MVQFINPPKSSFKSLEINVENIVQKYNAEFDKKGKELQKIEADEITDISFDEAFKNAEKYLVFEVNSTENLQKILQDKDTEYLYFKHGNVVIKAQKRGYIY